MLNWRVIRGRSLMKLIIDGSISSSAFISSWSVPSSTISSTLSSGEIIVEDLTRFEYYQTWSQVDRSIERQIAYKYYPNPSDSISQDFFLKKEKNVSLSGLMYSSGSRSFLWGFLRPLYGTNWKLSISVSTSMFLLMNITPVALSSSSEMINFRQPSGLRTISLT